MKWDYESEFTIKEPLRGDKDIFLEPGIESYPLEKLYEREKELVTIIAESHANEPSKKRGHKSDYRLWIKCTHDLIDQLHDIRDEKESRMK